MIPPPGDGVDAGGDCACIGAAGAQIRLATHAIAITPRIVCRLFIESLLRNKANPFCHQGLESHLNWRLNYKSVNHAQNGTLSMEIGLFLVGSVRADWEDTTSNAARPAGYRGRSLVSP